MPPQSPLAGLAAYGVPVGHNQAGQPVLQTGGGDVRQFLPPEIPGMPRMPGPPDWLSTGQIPGSGLFQPINSIQPFDSRNLVSHYQQQEQRSPGT
jgi:hypothetical protein